MKLNHFIGITLSSSLFLDSYPALATSVKFECVDRAIIAVTPDAKRTSSLISFNSYYFSSSGWSPEARCENIATRLNQALVENGGSLNNFYLTTGIVNGYPVICYVFDRGDFCNSQNVLLTVPLGTNVSQVLADMLGIWRAASGPIFESGEPSIIYVDLEQYIKFNLLGDDTTDAPGPEEFKKGVD